MDEIWRPLCAYDAKHEDGSWKYEVSSNGKVRSVPFVSSDGKVRVGRDLVQSVTNRGYPVVLICDSSGKYRTISVAKLVAMAFLDNPTGADTVRHLDGNRLNNSVENLFWGKVRPYVELRDRKLREQGCPNYVVRQYSVGGEFLAEYSSAGKAARAVFMSTSTPIVNCCKRKPMFNTCAGFIWRFPSDDEFWKESCSDGGQ